MHMKAGTHRNISWAEQRQSHMAGPNLIAKTANYTAFDEEIRCILAGLALGSPLTFWFCDTWFDR
jgi:hypothetical protein